MELTKTRRLVPWFVAVHIYEPDKRCEAWLPSDIATVAEDIALPPVKDNPWRKKLEERTRQYVEDEPAPELDSGECARTRDSTQSRTMILSAPTGVFVAVGPAGGRLAVFRVLLRYLSRSDVCKRIDERFLAKQLTFFATDLDVEQITDIESQLQDTAAIMKDNIGKMLDRGERLEDVADQSEDLLLQSGQLKRTSTKLKENQQKKNCKYTACIVCLAVCIFLLLGGGTFLGFFFDLFKWPF